MSMGSQLELNDTGSATINLSDTGTIILSMLLFFYDYFHMLILLSSVLPDTLHRHRECHDSF